VEFGRFAILAAGRPTRFRGRAFDAPMALIEASKAVVASTSFEPRPARQDRRSEQAVGH